MPLTQAVRILYVCSGNICRSPFAEAAGRVYADKSGLNLETRSASVLGIDGREPDPKMCRVAREVGIEMGGASTPLTADLVHWADHVMVMELHHAEAVRELLEPHGGPSVGLLGPYGGTQEIADPHGSWTARPYRRARDVIQRAVAAHIEQLAATLGL